MLDAAALIVIFCATLFVYLHVFYHLKTCDDLEILRISAPTKERLEEVCALRQPVVFPSGNISRGAEIDLRRLSNNNCKGDLQIRNVTHVDSLSEYPIPLSVDATIQLLSKDEDGRFFTERNGAFVEENSIADKFSSFDDLFRPSAVVGHEVDMMSGSRGAYTPFRYHVNYRHFLHSSRGDVRVRLSPPSTAKGLHMLNDYENMEFRVRGNLWKEEKVQRADILLRSGEVLFIPAYWIYSVMFEDHSTLVSFSYRTLMSSVSVSPQVLLRVLQSQNTRHTITDRQGTEEFRPVVAVEKLDAICEGKTDSVRKDTKHSKKKKKH